MNHNHNARQSDNNTAFDGGGEGLLVWVVGRFENWEIPQFDLLPVRLVWWKGGRKEDHGKQLCVNKQSCKVEQGLHLQGMSSPDVTAFLYNVHVSGYTTAARSSAIYYSRRTEGLFGSCQNIFLHSMHRVIIFLVVQMNEWRSSFLAGFIGRPLLGSKCLLFDWLILVLFTSFVKIIYLLLSNTKRKKSHLPCWYCSESHKSE